MEKQLSLAYFICVFIFEASQGTAAPSVTSPSSSPASASYHSPGLTPLENSLATVHTGVGTLSSRTTPLIDATPVGTPSSHVFDASFSPIDSVNHPSPSHTGARSSGHMTNQVAVSAGMNSTPVMPPQSKNIKICFKFDILYEWLNNLSDRSSAEFGKYSEEFIKQIKEMYKDVGFDLKDVIFENFTKNGLNVSASLCGVFGPKLSASMYVDETFGKEVTDGLLGEMPINKTSYKIEIRGVIIGDKFKAKAGECKRVCCGMGGPFTVEKSCSPSYKCRGIRFTKETSDCLSHCFLEDCLSSGNTHQISKAILLLVSTIWLMLQVQF